MCCVSGEDKYYIFSKGTYKIGRKGILTYFNPLSCSLFDKICDYGVVYCIGCDIIINKDKGVSRIHAELTFDATPASTSRRNISPDTSFVIRVKDCSKYGTFIKTDPGTKDKVHELPNKERILSDGDVITFGTGAATYRYS